MDRRSFLFGTSAFTLGAAGLGRPGLARAAEGDVWHIIYPGTRTREEAREWRDAIARQLGDAVGEDLVVTRLDGDHVVLYDRTGARDPSDPEIADQVARAHAKVLSRAFDDRSQLAVKVRAGQVQDTWNVRYGRPGTAADQRPVFREVARMLGPGVAKSLVVEETADGAHQVVYKRMGDRQGTEEVADHHAHLLRGLRIPAVAVPEVFLPIVSDTASLDPDEPAPETVAVVVRDHPSDTLDTGDGTRRPVGGPPLSSRINTHIQELRRRGRVSSVERTAWLVHDLVADEELAAINGDQALQAASMIKPFVALAFFEKVRQGRLVYGPRSETNLRAMIQHSDNRATNWMMEQVGGPRATHDLLHDRWGRAFRDLDIVEYIPSGGRTYRNKASVRAHGRLLRALWRDELPHSGELKRVMNLPKADRLYEGVPEIPAGTQVFNKTGTTAMCCGDMGILVARTPDGGRVPYVVVGVIERSQRASAYGSWMRSRGDVIRSVSGLTYAWMKDAYGLS